MTASTGPNEKDESYRSHPLPRFAPYGELTNSGAKSKKKYLAITGLVALLLLAREGGFVNWYLFSFNTNGKTQTVLGGIQTTQSGDKTRFTETSKSLVYTFTTNGKQAGFGSQVFDGSRVAVDLHEEIQNNLKKQMQITAIVDVIKLTGLYWLPFLKRGSCEYRVRLQFVGKDTLVYSGVLDGVTDFNFSGVCSTRTLKQILGDEIATRIVKSVDDLIRK